MLPIWATFPEVLRSSPSPATDATLPASDEREVQPPDARVLQAMLDRLPEDFQLLLRLAAKTGDAPRGDLLPQILGRRYRQADDHRVEGDDRGEGRDDGEVDEVEDESCCKRRRRHAQDDRCSPQDRF